MIIYIIFFHTLTAASPVFGLSNWETLLLDSDGYRATLGNHFRAGTLEEYFCNGC